MKDRQSKRHFLEIFLLAVIILVAALLRLVDLENYPQGFTADEAAMGYTAYSLLTTGRDEWGKPWPIFPQSVGDYKPPLYTYLVIPSIFIFGLSQTSVRLPAAVVGTLSVLVIFFLARELGLVPQKSRFRFASVTALLLAVSYWHIQLSRGAFETGLTMFFIPLGVLFFLKAAQSARISLFLFSAFSFGVSLYTYHSAKLITPILIVILCWLFKKRLWSMRKSVAVFAGFLLLFALPLILTLNSDVEGRVEGRSALANAFGTAAQKRQEAVVGGLNPKIAIVFDNKFTQVLASTVEGTLSYLSPQFLFTQGPGESTYGMMPGRGLFSLISVVFMAISLIVIARRGLSDHWLFILAWIIVGALPAALATGEGYAANRALGMLPPLILLSSFGFVSAEQFFPQNVKKLGLLVLLIVITVSLGSFLKDYRFRSYRQAISGYDYREMFNWLAGAGLTDKQMVISRSLSEPQTYAAFYLKLNPVVFQQNSHNWLVNYQEGMTFVDQMGDYSLANFEFRDIHWAQDREARGRIYLGRISEFLPTPTDGGKVLATFASPEYPDHPERNLVIVEASGHEK